jgi:hypothetical protein
MKLWCLILIVVLVLILVPARDVSTASSTADKLVYFVQHDDGVNTFTIYDAPRDEKISLEPITFDRHPEFQISVDGHLAFSSASEGIYVLDTQTPNSHPVPIITMPSHPLEWSLDGYYLAYADHDHARIYLWDGEASLDITPDLPGFFVSDVVWSLDDRLAIIGWADDVPSGIWVWDGQSVFHFDSSWNPAWSVDGQLAFFSQPDFTSNIFVWDGVNIPNPDTLSRVPLEPSISSDLVWTTTGLLAFEATDEGSRLDQIYVWDGQRATNISQNPQLQHSSPRWSEDGSWAFVTDLLTDPVLYVHDADDQTLLTVETAMHPAWSVNGYLAFCTPIDVTEWALSVWDGQRITQVVQGNVIWAQWQGGSDMLFCSNG